MPAVVPEGDLLNMCPIWSSERIETDFYRISYVCQSWTYWPVVTVSLLVESFRDQVRKWIGASGNKKRVYVRDRDDLRLPLTADGDSI
jgi:hypothetical protein